MIIEEILSISAVQDAITILPGTPPFLSIGNREPSWDGGIQLSSKIMDQKKEF